MGRPVRLEGLAGRGPHTCATARNDLPRAQRTMPTGAYRNRQIAEHFGLHLVTVGRIMRAGLRAGDSRGSVKRIGRCALHG